MGISIIYLASHEWALARQTFCRMSALGGVGGLSGGGGGVRGCARALHGGPAAKRQVSRQEHYSAAGASPSGVASPDFFFPHPQSPHLWYGPGGISS